MLVPATMFPAANTHQPENSSLPILSPMTTVMDPIIVPPPTPTRSVDMVFNDGHRLAILGYSLLIVISAFGNITVLFTILRRSNGKRLSRVNLMLFNLAIADLVVTFIHMPLEIGWAYTVSWEGGDTLCRLLSFFRTFGLFLSGFVLICISVDRLFAVTRPLNSVGKADRMGRRMLTAAWIMSTICSAPQALVFHVEAHPYFRDFTQCVTYHSFPSKELEVIYVIFGSAGFYIVPLIVISFCYSSIFNELSKRREEIQPENQIRRSSSGNIGRARIRTLQMTFVTVIAFFVCWMPYIVLSFWYYIDNVSASQIDQRIQKVFFVFPCTNSAVNPMVYGFFNFSRQGKRRPPANKNAKPPTTTAVPRDSTGWSPRGRLSTCTSISSASSAPSSPVTAGLPTRIVEEPENGFKAERVAEEISHPPSTNQTAVKL